MSARGAHTALRVAVAMTLAEILLIVFTSVLTAGAGAPILAGVLWVVFKCLPLAIVLPGLLRGNARAAIWLCFILCFYFPGAVLNAMAPPPMRWPGLLDVAIITTGFIAGLLAARWSRPAHSPPDETPDRMP